MQYRLVFIFILSILSLSSVFSQECTFGVFNSDCEVISSSFNTFNINLSPIEHLRDYSVSLYNKENPSNKINIEVDSINNRITNLNPLTQPGIYVFKIDARNRGGSSFSKEYEFIFDNLEPSPPIVPLKISGEGDIIINGTSTNGVVLHAKVQGKNVISSNINEGKFSLNLNNLNSGWNKVDFYVESENSLKSQIVERLVYSGIPIVENSQLTQTDIIINSLENPDLNTRTVKNENGIYLTTKRNFYIEGSVSNPKVSVYVHGVKVLSDGSGKFGSFVLLNEGENKIKVQVGNEERIINVIFTKLTFKFIQFDQNSQKIGVDSLEISGKVNLDIPFAVYLNGKFLQIIEGHTEKEDSFFSFTRTISGFKPGKNYLVLEGFNGARLSKIIYYDVESPKIEYVGRENINSADDIIFKITDDTGVDNSSLSLSVLGGGIIYTGVDFEVNGDYYKLKSNEEITNVNSLSLTVLDYFSKSETLNFNIKSDYDNVVIENISILDGKVKGKFLFLNRGPQSLTLIPTDSISFENIYLDGKEVLDYESREDGSVLINLNIKNERGVLYLSYFDSKLQKYEEELIYISDLEIPRVELDYIDQPSIIDNQIVKVTGKVYDSNFDWSTFTLNNQFVKRYGDYFEVNVILQDGFSNLNLYGRDISQNNVEPDFLGGIFLLDKTSTNLKVGKIFQDLFSITLENRDTFNSMYRNYNYITSYDGFDMSRTFAKGIENLVSHEREGIRSINLKGVEDSSQRIFSDKTISIDSTPPIIYLVEQFGDYKVLIDGTLSEVEQDVQVIINSSEGSQIASLSSCVEEVSVFSKCKKIENDLISSSKIIVLVEDEAGNSAKESFLLSEAINFDKILNQLSEVEIYFSGNDLYVDEGEDAIIQGQIRSSSPLEKVQLSDGTFCEFDDYNFVCKADYNSQINETSFSVQVFTLDLINSDSDSIPDISDLCPLVTSEDNTNSDGDSFGDICDFDDDNDGVNDSYINDLGVYINFTPYDNCRTIPNPDQLDSDNNSIGDACDSDIDGDGIDNSYDNCKFVFNQDQADSEVNASGHIVGDGEGDACDLDDDNDGILDIDDNCDFVASSNNLDTDGDGYGDVCEFDDDIDGDGRIGLQDTCPYVKDGDHRDFDNDGLGNICDFDDDNDTVNDFYYTDLGVYINSTSYDNCKDIPNVGQLDKDGDKKGDVCDDNIDGDTYLNDVDLCDFVVSDDNTNSDNDGLGNVCDFDDDNDGVNDSYINDLGIFINSTPYDNCQYIFNPNQLNTDGDKFGNACDFDDDNDGIPDYEDEYNVTYIEKPTIKFEEITGDGVFSLGGSYHSVIPEIFLEGNVDFQSIIYVLIKGETPFSIGNKEGNFSIPLDLTPFLSDGLDKEPFEINLTAENQLSDGKVSGSDTFTLIYHKVLKAFIRVFVE